MQLSCTGDPPHSGSTDYGSRTDACMQSDSIQNRLLQRCAPRRSIRHHPQAAASIQNNAARIVHQAPRRSHSYPLLKKPHWLPVEQRISYKLALLTFKIRQTSAPAYPISQHIIARSGTRSLRSSDVPLLHVPFRRTAIGKRSFSSAFK